MMAKGSKVYTKASAEHRGPCRVVPTGDIILYRRVSSRDWDLRAQALRWGHQESKGENSIIGTTGFIL